MWPLANPPAQLWEHAGIRCAIALGYAAWNGYVQLPRGHRWRLLDVGEVPADAHGGLTFGQRRAIVVDGVERAPQVTPEQTGGWVGFDTTHAWDYWPTEELPELTGEAALTRRMLNDLTSGMRYGYRVTWSLARLRFEVEALAEQVAAVPLERPIERARRQRLTSALRARERRAARRARRARR